MTKHSIGQYGVSYIWKSYQIDFQDLCNTNHQYTKVEIMSSVDKGNCYIKKGGGNLGLEESMLR